MPPKILLLSAYDAESHRYWHQNMCQQLSEFGWHVLTLKDRFFSWRMAANATNFKHHYARELDQRYDLVMATSMTDLVSVRGIYPHLGTVPNFLYFHENQFAYPDNPRQQGLLSIQLRSLMAADVADSIAFNSDYNRRSFLAGARQFIQRMPNEMPLNMVGDIERRSVVLPVPINADCVSHESAGMGERGKPLSVVWNHRWEHDKGPDTLLALMQLCDQEAIRFHIIGRRFKRVPKSMQRIIDEHAHQCLTLGYVKSRQDYVNILKDADVVLSTAHHDFQGIALLEAVACGCVPVAPNRLVYPDLYPADNLYPSTPESASEEAGAIKSKLAGFNKLKPVKSGPYWADKVQDYRQWIQAWL